MNREQLTDAVAAALHERKRRATIERFHGEHGKIDGWSREVTDLYRDLLRPSYEAMPEADRQHMRDVVAPTLEALENIGALRWGEEVIFEVVIDDPDMARRYDYEISTFSAYAAAIEGARRAIREDPNAGVMWPSGHCLTSGDREMLTANADLVEATAQYASVMRKVPERIVKGVEFTMGKA